MAYKILMDAETLIREALRIAREIPTVYFYACYGFLVTNETISAKAKQNCNGWYTPERVAALKKLVGKNPPVWGFDCVNLYKGIFWGWKQDEAKPKGGGASYGTNTVPDTNANGLFNKCYDKSSDFTHIEPGEALWMSGHFGLYVGNGLAVECTPKWSNGVQVTAVGNMGKAAGYNTRTWTKHGKLPWVDYKARIEQPSDETVLGGRWLQRNSSGADVVALQEALMRLGFTLPVYGADGDFGRETQNALVLYQKFANIEPTGIYDDATHAAMMEALNQLDANAEEDVEETPAQETVIVCTAPVSACIRALPGTDGAIISYAAKGQKLRGIAQAGNGWWCVKIGDGCGYISPKYAQPETV